MSDNSRIKHLKPNKNGPYKQGYIDPKTCKKYIKQLQHEPIIYRSSLELKFINYCENCESITTWGSEVFGIEYFDPRSNNVRHYYPDYIVMNSKGKKLLVEIKPYQFTLKPKLMESYAGSTWITNMLKWQAAKKWANDNGWEFIIVTEKFFNN